MDGARSETINHRPPAVRNGLAPSYSIPRARSPELLSASTAAVLREESMKLATIAALTLLVALPADAVQQRYQTA